MRTIYTPPNAVGDHVVSHGHLTSVPTVICVTTTVRVRAPVANGIVARHQTQSFEGFQD